MKSAIRAAIQAMSPRIKLTVFWLLFGASILLAIAPPLYLAGSGISAPVLGVPLSVAYWIFDALLATGAVWLLWIVENVRDEVGEEPAEAGA
jgi:membrane protein implicated in regulation of membrane protease activity